jgi:predicted nucleic acid-binding protein
MGWLKKLYGKTVALDTAPLIYFVEATPMFTERVQPFFEALARAEFKVLTSTLTITEALVKPVRHGQLDKIAVFKEILERHIRVVPATTQIAELAARLRAAHNLQTPDAIQVATALDQKADFFLTNDVKLSRLQQPQVLVLADLA